jgi:hypothetical protein
MFLYLCFFLSILNLKKILDYSSSLNYINNHGDGLILMLIGINSKQKFLSVLKTESI